MLTKISVFSVEKNFNKARVIRTLATYSSTKPSKIEKQKFLVNGDAKFIRKTNNGNCLFCILLLSSIIYDFQMFS